MSNGSDFQVRIINFWKKHKKKIFIIIIIWLIIIVINQILKHRKPAEEKPSTTYTPHITVMGDGDEKVPEQYQKPIEDYVEKYFNYCNNGEYEKAYELISDECKKNYFPTLEGFTTYVNKIFQGKKKIYNIQGYSIVDNKYTYNIRILDDILANGTSEPFQIGGKTYENGYYYYEEKLIFTEENGELKLSIQYVGDSEPNIIMEDENFTVRILKKVADYESETYTVQIDNKTDNYIVISDGTQKNEITMNYGGREKEIKNQIATLYIRPHSFAVRELTFENYLDEGRTADTLKFNAVRVLKNYVVEKGTTQENLDEAVQLYSFEINMK